MWDVTAKGLLTIKLHALERVLQQRQEILAALQPVPAEVRAWGAGAAHCCSAQRSAVPVSQQQRSAQRRGIWGSKLHCV